MKTRLILGLGLGLASSAFGQTSTKDLPEAPSATISQPKQQPPIQKPAQPPADQQTPAQAPANTQDQQAPSMGAPQNAQESTTGPPENASQSQQQPGASQKSPGLTPDPDVPTETIKKEVNEVNVVFTVTDKHGRFVKDLKKDDIKVLDDNKPPKDIVSFRSETDLPLRVGLLIDASNSIRDRFKFEQEAAIEFLNQIVRAKSDKAFVVGFDSVAEVTQDYTDSPESLAKGVRLLKAGGGTALFDAIYYACREKLMSPPTQGPNRRAIILLSDGSDCHRHR